MRAFTSLLAGLTVAWMALANAAPPQPAPLPAPPPMPAATSAPAATATSSASAADKAPAAGAVPRPDVERSNAASAGELGELSALEQLPPAHPIASDTRIEQIRQGNRVAEIRVTPAGGSRSYVIVTREPSRQQSLQDSGTGLSTPRFVRIEF